MTTRWMNRALVAAGLWVLSTTGAWALTLQVVGGGITATNLNYGCPAGANPCQSQIDFDLAGPANASGTIDINAAGTIATISLQIGSVTFNPKFFGSPIVFDPAIYSGTAPVYSSGTPGTILTISGLGPGSGQVLGNANGTGFNVYPSIVNFNCAITGGAGQCGLTFGRPGFTNVEGHDWVHTFNLNVTVPEPATALLAALGLAGLLLRTRRA